VGCTAVPQRVARSVPAAWAPRILVVAGAVAAGWVLFGGAGAAEAAQLPGSTHSSAAAAAPGSSDAAADVPVNDSGTVRRVIAAAVAAVDTAPDAVDPVSEPTRPATGEVDGVVTPTLDGAGDALEPPPRPLDEVVPADHGEPQVPSVETPSGIDPVLGAETPQPLSVGSASTPEPGQPSSGPPAAPAPHAGDALVMRAFGPVAPAPPTPGFPTPGDLAGVVGATSGPGSADRLSGAAVDVVPTVVTPRLITDAVPAGDSVAVRERANRPQVSPD
jgi:hypothetical protein